jgi:hypothetical protein
MLSYDLSSNRFLEPETEQQDDYPDEVLESEWSPVLAEIQSVRPNVPEPPKLTPTLIDTALLRRYH